MPAPIHLTTLGSLDVTDPVGDRLTGLAGQQKRLAVLVYLAVEGAGGPVERDLACAVFWPEHDQERARANLRNALHFLRGELPTGALETIGDERVELDPEALSCDAAQALTEGKVQAPGTFLDGVHFRGASAEFYDWVEDVRARLDGLPRVEGPEAPAASGTDGADAHTRAFSQDTHPGTGPLVGAEPGPRPEAREMESAVQSRSEPRHHVRSRGRRGAMVLLGAVAVGAVALWAAGAGGADPVTDSEGAEAGVGTEDEADGAPTRNDRVLVMPFAAATDELRLLADAGFDRFMSRLTAGGVAQVVGYETLAAQLGDPEAVDLKEAADSARANLVVLGRVSATGGEVRVRPRLVRTADEVWEVALPPEDAPVDAPMGAFEASAERMLAALGAELSPTWGWPPHNPPPSLAILRLEKEALDAFYALDYDGFHILADSAMALDTAYFPAVMLNHKASAYWNRRRHDPANLFRADTVLTYMESQTARFSPGERLGIQWLRSLLDGNLYDEFEAVSLPSIEEASERGPYRLAMSARRTNRLPLAIDLIDRRYRMHPRGIRYIAWDEVLLQALARSRDFARLRDAARAGREREPGYGVYLNREAEALAGLGEFDAVGDVVAQARVLPANEIYNAVEVYNPATHLMAAASVAYAEGRRDAARTFANRVLEQARLLRGNSVDVRRVEAAAFGVLGRWDAAVARLETLVAEEAPQENLIERWGLYGAALAQAGREAEARAAIVALEGVIRDYDRFYVRGLALGQQARIHAALGEHDRALRNLQEGFQSGLTHGEWEIWDIHLIPLHDDPRYAELTRIRDD